MTRILQRPFRTKTLQNFHILEDERPSKSFLNLENAKIMIMQNILRLRTAKVSMMNFIGHLKKSIQNKKMLMIVLKLYRNSWVVAMILGHQNISPTLLSPMPREIR